MWNYSKHAVAGADPGRRPQVITDSYARLEEFSWLVWSCACSRVCVCVCVCSCVCVCTNVHFQSPILKMTENLKRGQNERDRRGRWGFEGMKDCLFGFLALCLFFLSLNIPRWECSKAESCNHQGKPVASVYYEQNSGCDFCFFEVQLQDSFSLITPPGCHCKHKCTIFPD